MLDTLAKLLVFQDRRTRVGLLLILLASLLTSGLELAGIGLFLPLLQAVLAPEQLAKLPFLGPKLYEAFVSASQQTLAWAAFFIFLFFAAKNGLIYLLIYVQKRFVFYSEARFRAKVYASYLRRPYEETLALNSSEISRNLMRSVTQMFTKSLMPFVEMVMELLIAFGAITALLLIEPIGSLMAFVLIASTLFFFYWFAQHKLSLWGRELEDTSTSMYRWISEGLGALKETKVLGREGYFEKAFLSASEKFAHFSFRVTTIQQVPRLMGEVAVLGVMFLIVAMFVSREGSLTGALPVLGVFAAASLRILPSLSRIVQAVSSIRQSAASVNYVYSEFISVQSVDLWKSRADAPVAKAPFEHEIVLNDVTYAYPGAKAPALVGVSFKIAKGETVAIVGPSGAGKTTLADLLLGLLKPQSGSITADGLDIFGHLQAWRRQVGFVSQSTHVFDDTLPRNVAFGVPDDAINLERVRNALRLSRLEESLAASVGFEKPLGEFGKRLSGGQRQRIGIARALYESPGMLILDEATSALDNVTEQEVSQSIADLSQGKTLVIIAHRLSTVMRASKLVYLDAGRVLAVGAYAELLSDCPQFRRQVEQGSFTNQESA